MFQFLSKESEIILIYSTPPTLKAFYMKSLNYRLEFVQSSSSSSPSFKCALKESGCRIGYEPTKVSRDHLWRSISRDTNVEVSAWSPAGDIN